MGKKRPRHRLSDCFESPPAEETTEEVEDASLVHVAYPSPAYDCALEEGPSDQFPVPEEYCVPEECPPPEECAESPRPAAEIDIFAQDAPTGWDFFGRERQSAHEPTVEEAEPAPQEELPEDVPAEEFEPEIPEEPAQSLPVEEAADEPEPEPESVEIIEEEETLQHADLPTTERPAEDNDEQDAEDAEDVESLTDQPGELVLVCTSCTRMILIEYDGACPYSSITALTGPDHESSSWLLHTTCLSCLNKHKGMWHNRDNLSKACSAAFTSAMLSEEFMMQTRCFEIAQRVCWESTPMTIVMNRERRSVASMAVDVLREETTDECRVMGLKYAGKISTKVCRSEIVQPFAPGGFM